MTLSNDLSHNTGPTVPVIRRCSWSDSSPLLREYHDAEWGYPQHDDGMLFEHLILITFQSGLSWEIILRKRANLRQAFDGYNAAAIARYADHDVARLLADSTIIRNQAKVRAAINNARQFLAVQQEFGSFDRYLWQFTDYQVRKPGRDVSGAAAPLTTSPESDAMARDMQRRGFRFVGSVTCYAYMQSIGMVDDHEPGCFRYRHAT